MGMGKKDPETCILKFQDFICEVKIIGRSCCIHTHLSKVMMGCTKARVIIFDTNNGAMVLTTARGHALSLHQDSFAEQRSALGSRIGLSPRLMLKNL